MNSLSPSQHRPQPEMIPRPLLLAMLGLVLASLALTSFAVLTGREKVGQPVPSAIVQERVLVLQGGGAQAVTVLDASGRVLMDLPHGGFITVIQNGLTRARTVARVDQSLPVRLVEHANGRLTLIDDASGFSAELGAFGSDNRAAFARLLELP
jgi:putative photosynthetic complex assembly protein